MDVVRLIEWSAGSKRLRRVVVIAAVLAVVVVAPFVVRRYLLEADATRQLAEAIAAADRADSGWRLGESEPTIPAIPDDRNGALVVLQAAELLPAPSASWYFRGNQMWSYDSREGRLSEDQYAALVSGLKSYDPEAIALARTLHRFPTGRYPAATKSTPPNQPGPSEAALLVEGVLLPLIYVHIHEGDVAAAMQDCRSLMNLGLFVDPPRDIRRGPYWQYFGVRVPLSHLERALFHGEAPAGELADFQADIVREESKHLLVVQMRRDRAATHELVSEVEQGQRTFNDALDGRHRPYVAGPVIADWFTSNPFDLSARGRLRLEHAAFLHTTAQVLEMDRRPIHEFRASLVALRDSEELRSLFLTKSMINFWLVDCGDEQSRLARLRSMIVVLAVERYRLAHGAWPKSLADVVPEFLPAIPADPFDGQPICYRRTADGVVIYSIGPNGKDDGGDFYHQSPPTNGTDIGFTLWDVNRRHQPPREKRP